MELFNKSSNQSKLRESLDRETEDRSGGCAVEELPCGPREEKKTELSGKPTKTVFQVDLLSGWVMP